MYIHYHQIALDLLVKRQKIVELQITWIRATALMGIQPSGRILGPQGVETVRALEGQY